MRVKLDENLPIQLKRLFTESGHDAATVGDEGLGGAPDAEIATVCIGEERVLVPSPKVATYDLQPEMSAAEVTDRVVEAIAGGRFDLIVVNYANADMVGHTGDLNAAMAAVAAVDQCLGRLAAAIEEAGGALLITADHGNAEQMRGADSETPHTAHTHGPVPAVLVGAPGVALRDGGLADVAPTVLDLMGLPAPAAMSGRSLAFSAPASDAAQATRPRQSRAR